MCRRYLAWQSAAHALLQATTPLGNRRKWLYPGKHSLERCIYYGPVPCELYLGILEIKKSFHNNGPLDGNGTHDEIIT